MKWKVPDHVLADYKMFVDGHGMPDPVGWMSNKMCISKAEARRLVPLVDRAFKGAAVDRR